MKKKKNAIVILLLDFFVLRTTNPIANNAIVDPATNTGWNSISLYVAFVLFYLHFISCNIFFNIYIIERFIGL
jgi:hypothetical protein